MRHQHVALFASLGISAGWFATAARATVIFSADFNSTMNAQVAGGNSAPQTNTATLDGGALNTSTVTPGNGARYETAGNFNPTAGTVEMWFKAPGYDGSFRMDLFDIFQGSYDGDFNLYFQPNQGGRLQLVVAANGANQFFMNGYSTPASTSTKTGDGQWHHVAWEWDTTAGTPFTSLYLDGVAENYTPSPGSTVAWPAGATLGTYMDFGSRQDGYDNVITHIDDVRIHDAAIYNQVASFTPEARTIPEPGSLVVLAVAGSGFLLRRRGGVGSIR
jgi:hypothetical protein